MMIKLGVGRALNLFDLIKSNKFIFFLKYSRDIHLTSLRIKLGANRIYAVE